MLQQLIELREKIAAKSATLATIFAEANTGEGKYDFTKVKALGPNQTAAAVADQVGTLNNELTALGKEEDVYAKAMQADADQKLRQAKAGQTSAAPIHSAAGTTVVTEEKSFGRQFVESKAYTDRNSKASAALNIGTKTLFERSAGWAPQSTRTGLVVPYAVRPIQVTDLIPTVPTSQAAYVYMEETTFTNNAIEKAEGVAFGEAALALTQRSVVVEKIPVWIPVTDEQLDDQAGIEQYLDNRLTFMIRQRLDGQIINGDGSTPNVYGILNKGGVLGQAKGADPVPDCIRKAMTKVRVTGRAMPNAVIMHPNDWQDVKLLRTTTGEYIWGNPSAEGPERIWSRPVAECDAIAENTGLVGDFANYALMVERQAMDVQIGFVDDDFIKGKKAVRATIRVALAWIRPSAFCYVTSV